MMHTHCENCGGDGGWSDEYGRWDDCPACGGTGEYEIERELIVLDDFEECFGC